MRIVWTDYCLVVDAGSTCVVYNDCIIICSHFTITAINSLNLYV
jgi:hypothetical protein